jgi:hypothetical protein
MSIRPIGLQCGSGHRLSFFRRGDVDRHGDRFAAGSFDIGGNLVRFGILNISNDNFAPSFARLLCISLADADAAACDDRYFILQTHGVPPLD